MDFLLTGGAGFIGSTIASAAIDAGHRPIIIDNLVTGRREFVRDRIFYEGDIADRRLVREVLTQHPTISTAIHCAGLIVVPDSVERPGAYYRANVVNTLDLVEELLRHRVDRLIFSSSASIYQTGGDFSVDEASTLAPTSPYARTKLLVEQMLADIAAAGNLRVLSLRYFNPIGADPHFRTGLQTTSPGHVLGKLIEAHEHRQAFSITGDDYPTPDGTGIRDYVHVWDLASAHVAALDRFNEALASQSSGAINLGTGQGTSVKELIDLFVEVTRDPMETCIAPRRPGDTAGAFTRSDKAERLLGWTAQHTLQQGVADTLTWMSRRGEVLPDLA